MASFKEAWEETSAVEGGYVDDDDDRGGETYRGVARNFHPDWPGWDRIDAAKDDPGFPGILGEDESLDEAGAIGVGDGGDPIQQSLRKRLQRKIVAMGCPDIFPRFDIRIL